MRFDCQNYNVPAGGEKHINLSGKYFLLVEVESNVNVTFVRNNSKKGYAEEVGAGFGIGPVDEGFHGVKIESTNASAQTVKVYIGDDPSIYNIISGIVSVNGSLPDFATDPQIAGITDPVTVDEVTAPLTPPDAATTRYYRSSASAAINTVVTPAANTNGIKVTFLCPLAWDSISSHIVMATSTPSTITDGTSLAYSFVRASASYVERCTVPLPITIPAGYGLYEGASAGSSTSGCIIAYEVL